MESLDVRLNTLKTLHRLCRIRFCFIACLNIDYNNTVIDWVYCVSFAPFTFSNRVNCTVLAIIKEMKTKQKDQIFVLNPLLGQSKIDR